MRGRGIEAVANGAHKAVQPMAAKQQAAAGEFQVASRYLNVLDVLKELESDVENLDVVRVIN